MKHLPEVFFGLAIGRDTRISGFEGFCYEVSAYDSVDVVPALKSIESAVHEGLHAAGFISYEAASALDGSLSTKEPAGFPLLWFGLYRERRSLSLEESFKSHRTSFCELSKWQPTLSREEYRRAVARIRDYIAAGDIYQVNYTLRERCSFSGDVRALYRDLCRSQSTSYSAFFDLDRYSILSASPELFFQLDNGVLTVRPMKGTARRGRWLEEDEENVRNLRWSEKERAENLMIVDLLRNDLGRGYPRTGRLRLTLSLMWRHLRRSTR